MVKKYNLPQILFLFAIILALVVTGYNPCANPVAKGYSRYVPPQDDIYSIRFDYPSDWELDLTPPTGYFTLRFKDPTTSKLSVSSFAYTHDLSESQEVMNNEINSARDFASGLKDSEYGAIVSEDVHYRRGYRIRIISIDLKKPWHTDLHVDPITPVIFLRIVYITAGDTMYGMQFTVSDSVDEQIANKQINHLLNSICVIDN